MPDPGIDMSLAVAAAVVAVVAAMRSTWSPCGLSMLSTITPVTERARGHRFGVTATWFVLGATIGGACLGSLAALGAWAVAAAGVPVGATLFVGALVCVAGALVDGLPTRFGPPFYRRQVNDDWLRQYRPWVYASGFGWQIGAGVTTYIMTCAVPAMIVLAIGSATPLAALAIGTGFGLLRGLAVLAGAAATSPAGLRRIHARFEAWEAPVRHLTVFVLAITGSALGYVMSHRLLSLAIFFLVFWVPMAYDRRKARTQTAATISA